MKMQAALYSKESKAGVKLATVPRPTLTSSIYDPKSTTILRFLFFKITSAIAILVCHLMKLVRWLLPSTPKPYGEKADRQWVLCRVHSVGLNPVDAKFLYGDKLPQFCLPMVKWFVENQICGIDFSGTIVEAPLQCGYEVGDDVFGTIPPFFGSLAEYVRAPTDFLSLKPKNMSHTEACAIPLVGLTALQAFEDHNLIFGQHVLVLGASGGTGHVAVQIAKAKGAQVTAVTSSRNADFVRDLGADIIILYDQSSNLFDELHAATSMHGPFNLVFDSVSSHDPRDSCFQYETRIRCAEPKLLIGTYIFIGGLVTDWILAHLKRYFGINWFGRDRELFWVRFPNSTARLALLRHFCETKQLKVRIANRMLFTEASIQEAFQLQLSRRIAGKIVIEIVPGNRKQIIN